MTPGDIVECIDDTEVQSMLRRGRLYTIRRSYGPYVDVGVVAGRWPGFLAVRFRVRCPAAATVSSVRESA